MFFISLHDTFIQQLYNIVQQLDSEVTHDYLYGRSGHGTRFSLAMNTKTGKEIGHPSGHYSWDVVSVVEQCFPDLGIETTLFIGPGYATRARTTAAQSERKLSEEVVLLENYELSLETPITGNLLYVDEKGIWHTASSSDDIDVEWEELPFGPVIIQVHGITKQTGFPASTFRYLVDTLERGEEPMEIRGRNNYSTVSGWKAFARWMQSYSIPLPNVQHDHLKTQPLLLIERRYHFLKFLYNLSSQLNNKQEVDVVNGLANKYKHVLEVFLTELTENSEQVLNNGLSPDSIDLLDINQLQQKSEITLSNVRTCYFAEQKTLTYYKKIDTYLTHHL